MSRTCVGILATVLLFTACGSEHVLTLPDVRQVVDDVAVDGEADGALDVEAQVDAGGPMPPVALCADGVAMWPFDASATQVAYDAPVPDFTAQTMDGTFTLSEVWNGCDQYVLVIRNPNLSDVSSFWSSAVGPLLTDSAPNAHYLFLVPGQDAATRESLLQEVRTRMDNHLLVQGEEAQAAWAGRLHYVLDDAALNPVVAGAVTVSLGEAHVTIDRHQRLREGHNTAIVMGGSWSNRLEQVRYWARYYNAQYALDEALSAEEAAGEVMVHRVADAQDIMSQGWSGGHPVTPPHTWTLPAAEDLAAYGQLEVDLRVGCPDPVHPYGVACGEWDTVGGLFLCTDADCTAETRRRVIKWITPYSAPGRWLIDISPELVHLTGGDLQFVTAGGDNDAGPYTYRYTVDLRFKARGDGLRPFAIETLVPRGNYGWNDSFHDQWSTWEFTPPEGTKRVELYARISGHGAVDGTYCAEFCTFTHQFAFNDTPFAHTYLMEQSVNRCAALVDEGVVPNQGGTWFYDRSSWCPGWVIEEWREDVTAAVDLTGPNAIAYTSGLGTVANGTTGGGNMDMRVELVFYR